MCSANRYLQCDGVEKVGVLREAGELTFGGGVGELYITLYLKSEQNGKKGWGNKNYKKRRHVG